MTALRIPHPLAAAARARPQHPAVVLEGRAIVFAALHARAVRWAGALTARGVAPGETVALVGPTDEAWVTALHAIGLAGAVVAPIDAAADEPAIAEAVAAHGAAWVVDVREGARPDEGVDVDTAGHRRGHPRDEGEAYGRVRAAAGGRDDTNDRHGDTNGRDADTNGPDGDTNGRDGDTNAPNSDTNARDGDTNGRDADTNARNSDTSAALAPRTTEAATRTAGSPQDDDSSGKAAFQLATARITAAIARSTDATSPTPEGHRRADDATGPAAATSARHRSASDAAPFAPSPPAPARTFTPAGLDAAAAPALPERDWPLDEPRVSVLTSGTTGQPRRIVLTTAQLVFSALGSAARLGHHLDDRWLLCLPTHHVGGLSILFRTAWLATTALVEPRFDAARIAERIEDATLVSLVPAMLARLLDARGDRPFSPRLRAILLGGDRAPTALVERARALGAPLALTWGMSETASQIATLPPDRLAEWHEGEVGPALPFARVTTEDGALVVEGPLAPAGRLVTADRGLVRDDGTIEVHGRRDLVFISGGENVDPQRVEAALRTHPAIADALVVGLPDATLGQRAAAALVARPGAERPSLPDIREHLAPRLARAERPVRVAWTDALPLGTSGKPSRERARALLQDMEDHT